MTRDLSKHQSTGFAEVISNDLRFALWDLAAHKKSLLRKHLMVFRLVTSAVLTATSEDVAMKVADSVTSHYTGLFGQVRSGGLLDSIRTGLLLFNVHGDFAPTRSCWKGVTIWLIRN